MTEDNAEEYEFDEEALAEAYEKALALEKAGDIEGAAEGWREVLRLDPADHGGAAVRLAALGRGDTPPKAPDAYVATLFDQHAEMFDAILVDQLGYHVPEMVRDILGECAPKHSLPGTFSRLLDLGCGTGLAGEYLHDRCDHLTGVDLAETMIEMTDEREVYDDLYVGEAVAFLEASLEEGDEPWDLVVATDVLPYLGGIEAFIAGAAAVTAPGGLFAFSSETLSDETLAGRPYMVGPKQRFAHSGAYVREVLAANGFDCLEQRPIVVRYEDGEAVPGHLVLARAG
ncbi:MAG: S-adenosylmethionine-dependent methyltransferase [Hyphomicrobiales bacterium]|nr:MAG: S-adenosylmethionine-dependent methyltransferase [Hyphomicrobiales bacterium]